MKSLMKMSTLGLVLALLALGTVRNAQAAGTAAGTDISNTATLDYQVGGNAQPTKTSNTLTFKVDRKINLTVARTDASIVSVSPGQNGAVLTFTVTNNGNSAQDFSLQAIAEAAATADPFGGAIADNLDASSAAVYVESGGSAGYQAAQDTATSIGNLAADGVKTVYIVLNIPNTALDTNVAVYGLRATARELGGAAITETVGADTAGTMDTVFADAAGSDDSARDAAHSARSAVKVASAQLSITKSSAVISDPTNNTTNPKAIPGAVVEYTITIANAAGAGAAATNISTSDSLNGEITAGHIAFNTNAYAAGKGIQVTAPNINAGAALALTNTADADQGSFAANIVSVSGIALNAGQTATVKFQVVVQ